MLPGAGLSERSANSPWVGRSSIPRMMKGCANLGENVRGVSGDRGLMCVRGSGAQGTTSAQGLREVWAHGGSSLCVEMSECFTF